MHMQIHNWVLTTKIDRVNARNQISGQCLVLGNSHNSVPIDLLSFNTRPTLVFQELIFFNLNTPIFLFDVFALLPDSQ